MASRPLLTRARISLFEAELCAFCQTRPLRRTIHRASARNAFSKTQPTSGWDYSPRNTVMGIQLRRYVSHQAQSMSPQQMRAELDKRSRLEILTIFQKEGLLPMSPQVADKVIIEFESRGDTHPSTKVIQLAEKHKLQLVDLTNLAHALHRAPDVKDKSGRVPPSPHKKIAKTLFLACSKAKEPTATLHILNAVYLSASHPVARDAASQFSQAEIRVCRQELQDLAAKNDAESMTLLGQFVEREGSRQTARELYEGAMDLQDPKYDSTTPRPGFQRMAPWNALGLLLLAEQNPKSLQHAKEAFHKGALEGDDPLSYYHLALLEEKNNGDWLRYMTKAAGSGHVEAMCALANFYMGADPQRNKGFSAALSSDKLLDKALRWILKWKPGRTGRLGLEWFRAAAFNGHKPSMLTVVDDCDARKDYAEAEKWLKVIAGPPHKGQIEQWPGLVEQAKRRLQKKGSQTKPVTA